MAGWFGLMCWGGRWLGDGEEDGSVEEESSSTAIRRRRRRLEGCTLMDSEQGKGRRRSRR